MDISQLQAYNYNAIFLNGEKYRVTKFTVAFGTGWLLVNRILAFTSPPELANKVYFAGIKYSSPLERRTVDSITHLQIVQPELGEKLEMVYLIGKCELGEYNRRIIVNLPNSPFTMSELLPYEGGGVKRLVNSMYRWS